jgi:hypothetical protein
MYPHLVFTVRGVLGHATPPAKVGHGFLLRGAPVVRAMLLEKPAHMLKVLPLPLEDLFVGVDRIPQVVLDRN